MFGRSGLERSNFPVRETRRNRRIMSAISVSSGDVVSPRRRCRVIPDPAQTCRLGSPSYRRQRERAFPTYHQSIRSLADFHTVRMGGRPVASSSATLNYKSVLVKRPKSGVCTAAGQLLLELSRRDPAYRSAAVMAALGSIRKT